MSPQDIENLFLEFLIENDLRPIDGTPIIGDGKRRRFRTEGSPKGRKNGWYKLHADERPVGVAGTWSRPGKVTWTHKGSDVKVTREQRQAWEAKRKAEAEKVARLAEKAAVHCQRIWKQMKPATIENPYAAKKHIMPIRARAQGPYLVVPVWSYDGKLTSLQFIAPNGEKRFVFGGRVEGCYSSIHTAPPKDTEPFVICEGYATACTIHEATGYAVIIAFNAGNLVPVAEAIRRKYPDRRLLIVADNDRFTTRKVKQDDGTFKDEPFNPGVVFARQAAAKVTARIAVPVFRSDEARGTDVNDLAREEGLACVHELIDAVMNPLPEPPPPEPERLPAPAALQESASADGELFAFSGSFMTKQSGIAAELVRSAKGRVVYDELRDRFYVFDKVWRYVTEGDILRRVKSLFDEAIPAGYSTDLLTSSFRLFRLTVGHGKESPLEWNTDGYLPVQNGILNLDTLELEPFSQAHRINWILPYAYDPEARCPTFDLLIERLSSGDPHTKRLLIAFLAAIIRGRHDLQRYLELVGSAGAGKSSYMRVAEMLVGRENVVSSNMRHLGQNRFETAGFYAKRLAVFPDERDHVGDGTDTFKAITGGDGIRYEQKNLQQGENFTFEGMVIVACNSPMTFEDYSGAIPRRRMSVKIDYSIKTKDRDPRFMEKLASEMPGVLNYLLTIPNAEIERILLDVDGHRSNASLRALIETNPIYEWYDHNLVLDEGITSYNGSLMREAGKILHTDVFLYPNFVEWSESSGRRGTVSLRKFHDTMKELIRTQDQPVQVGNRSKRGVPFIGLKLRKEWDFAVPSPLTGVLFDV